MQARLATELAKRYERPTGEVDKLAMIRALQKSNGLHPPIARHAASP